MSPPSDRVLGTPPTNTSARSPADSTHASETGLANQQRERETALHEVARLRKEASAEIERLLDFLDACDPYVTHELEEDDGSNPEGPDDDLEDGAEPDDADNEASAGFDAGEPSLGWTVDGCTTGGTGQGRWDVQDDLEISVY